MFDIFGVAGVVGVIKLDGPLYRSFRIRSVEPYHK